MKKTLIDVVISTILGLGLVFLASPLFLYWLIHGDYDRYIWIINGPYPFSSFGSGPFQAAMGLSLLFVGAILIVVAILLRKKL